jgi:hypothetical protein
VASGESVTDAMTGQALRFEVVSGEEAVRDPLMKGEDTSVDYIKVYPARPVSLEGQARLLILKTYKDAKSYFREGDAIVFNRSLSIPRNSVVLPVGYELVACKRAVAVSGGAGWPNCDQLHERQWGGGSADCERQARRSDGGSDHATAAGLDKKLGSPLRRRN